MLKRNMFLVCCLFMVTGFFQSAKAEDQSVAVIDRNKLMKEATVLLAITEEMNKKADSYRETLIKQEEKLKNQGEKLSNNKGGLSKDNLKKAVEKYKKDIVDFQNSRREKEQYYNTAFQKSMNDVFAVVEEIVKEIMNEKKFSVVLWKSQVVVASDALDITSLVIEKLNQKLPKLNEPVFKEE